jgi:hypothetical protein
MIRVGLRDNNKVKKDSDHSAGTLKTERTGLLAEENQFDRRTLWRIGTWGVAAVGAVVVAVMANQTSLGWRREQAAATDLSRQAQQLQSISRDSQSETRRLAAAVDTLNNDRDRLYARITVLEQGLDSVTGAVAKQNSSTPPPSVSKSAAAGPVPSNTADPQPTPPTQAALPTIGPVVSALSPTVPSTSLPSPEKPRAESVKADLKAAKPEAKSDTRSELKPETKPDIKPDPKSETKPEAKVEPKVEAKIDTWPDQASSIPSPATQAANPLSAVSSFSTPGAATTTTASLSVLGPPDPVASKLEPVKPANAAPPPAPVADAMASASAKEGDPPDAASDKLAVQRTEFAVDLGTANSVNGLRALWRGLLKSNASLAELHPIIVIKEGNTGLGMQLRLAAGPLRDAAAAAKICAALVEGKRICETTVYDGQRLAMSGEEAQPPATKPLAGATKSYQYKRYPPRHAAPAAAEKREEPPPPPPPQQPKPEPSSISSLFRR